MINKKTCDLAMHYLRLGTVASVLFANTRTRLKYNQRESFITARREADSLR